MKLALLTLLLCGCQSLTDVVVRVDADRTVSGEIASVAITVTDVDGSDGGARVYASQPLPICAAGQHDACYSFPITVTLRPGGHSPDEKVRVQVDAKMAANVAFSSDAALFTFTPHTGKTLDFFLAASCKATDCASANQACDSGACNVVTAQTGSAPPDMTTPAAPATSVSRMSFATGVFEAQPGQAYHLPPPDTQAGDLVVVGLINPGALSPQSIPTAWRLLGQVDPSTAVLYFQVAGQENDDPYRFTFTAPTPHFNGTGTWAMAVFRGVAPPVHAPTTTNVTGGSDAQLTLSIDDGSSLAPGGELVVLALTNGDELNCVPSSTVTTVDHVSGNATLIEVPAVGAGPVAPFTLGCKNTNFAQSNAIYQFVLNPAP